MSTKGPVHYFKPSEQYNRLLEAFELEQSPHNSRAYFITLSDILGVRISQLSDCIRRGFVTQPVLDAAQSRGINPDFIKHGTLPIKLDKSGQGGRP